MKFDEKVVKKIIKDYNELEERAYEVLMVYLHTNDRCKMDITGIKLWWGFVGFFDDCFTFNESNPDAGYGPHYPRDTIAFPLRCLWSDKLTDIINLRVAEEKAEREKWEEKIKAYNDDKAELKAKHTETITYLRNKYPFGSYYSLA